MSETEMTPEELEEFRAFQAMKASGMFEPKRGAPEAMAEFMKVKAEYEKLQARCATLAAQAEELRVELSGEFGVTVQPLVAIRAATPIPASTATAHAVPVHAPAPEGITYQPTSSGPVAAVVKPTAEQVQAKAMEEAGVESPTPYYPPSQQRVDAAKETPGVDQIRRDAVGGGSDQAFARNVAETVTLLRGAFPH